MKIYFYVLNTLADWEVGYLTAELNSGRFLDKTKEAVTLVRVGNTLDPVVTMGGMAITPEATVDTVTFNEGDLLILPGADTWLEEANQRVLGMVSELLDNNITVAAICGATMGLAKAGILNDRRHTSNDQSLLIMMRPEYSGDEHYMNHPVVVDGHLITASGLAPLDFSYEVLKKINVMRLATLEAWYKLHKTQDGQYFHALIESMNA